VGVVIKYLTDDEVASLVGIEELLDAVAEGFRALSMEEVVMPMRSRFHVEKEAGDILLMPCLAPSLDVFSLKVVSVFPRNLERGIPTLNAVVVILDPSTGVPKIVADGKALTGLRTAAASALSIIHLAKKDASRLGLIGCGQQGRWQLQVCQKVMKPEKVQVYDIDGARARSFVAEMTRRLGIDIYTADSAERLARTCDVIITATTSRTPVVMKEWVSPGTHISAIGAYTPEMAEIDPRLVAASKVVVDQMEAAMGEAGDIIQAVKGGLMSWSDIYGEIGEIIAGKKRGRVADEEITIFKTVGTAVQDAAVASILLSKVETP
jgi:alanine dehydrogenase